jgi:hypothetical protein
MRRKDRFDRRGTFKCMTCERVTRNSGQDVDHLCFECFELAGLDNMVNDNGPETLTDSVRKEVDALVKAIAAKGGNVENVKKSNAFLFNA